MAIEKRSEPTFFSIGKDFPRKLDSRNGRGNKGFGQFSRYRQLIVKARLGLKACDDWIMGVSNALVIDNISNRINIASIARTWHYACQAPAGRNQRFSVVALKVTIWCPQLSTSENNFETINRHTVTVTAYAPFRARARKFKAKKNGLDLSCYSYCARSN